jgi:hypothetical protein
VSVIFFVPLHERRSKKGKIDTAAARISLKKSLGGMSRTEGGLRPTYEACQVQAAKEVDHGERPQTLSPPFDRVRASHGDIGSFALSFPSRR